MFALLLKNPSLLLSSIIVGGGDDALGDDAMARLDDDYGLGPGEEMVIMEIANDFRLHTTKPSVL